MSSTTQPYSRGVLWAIVYLALAIVGGVTVALITFLPVTGITPQTTPEQAVYVVMKSTAGWAALVIAAIAFVVAILAFIWPKSDIKETTLGGIGIILAGLTLVAGIFLAIAEMNL
jgi:hypothetical protein